MTARDETPYRDAPPEVVAALGGHRPTLQQWRALSHPLTPGVIVAGAGSGKTAVMAARLVYLALVATGRLEADHPGALPSRVLCLTFTNKAAEELSRRVLRAVGPLGLPEGEEPTVLTYHAFAARLLDDYGLRMGMEPGQMLLSDAQKWQLVRSSLDDVEFDAFEVRSDYVVGEALGLDEQLAHHLVEPDEAAAYTERLAAADEVRTGGGREGERIRTALAKRLELLHLVRAYRERKGTIGAIDYGDQIALAERLVREHPAVVEEFRERFSVVLLDEYQDTNHAQARLLEALCGRGYPVLAVGDPDQNIYAWRGANLQNILRFEDEFGGRGDGRRPLYVNFRSGSRILDVANAVIEPVPVERRAPDKVLRPHPGRGAGRVEAFVATDARAEARQMVARVRELVDAGTVRYQDVAVLCRKSRLFEDILEVFREEQIPVEVVDLGGLLRSPEVVDVVSWLRVLDDPGRNVALARLLMGPRWRIGYRDLRVLAVWSARRNKELEGTLAEGEDMPGEVSFALAEALDHLDDPDMTGLSEEARERLGDFRGTLGRLRAAATGSLGDLVERVIEGSGLWRELEASRNPAAIGARRNLLNFIQHVSSFSPVDGEASLSTLISYLDAVEETGDEMEPAQPSEADAVKVLTIHKAKGLEWPVVFVPGLAEGTGRGFARSDIFPDVSRQPNPLTQPSTLPFELRGDREGLPAYDGDLKAFKDELTARGLEEERRLCYVALTRARDLLVVSAAHWYPGPAEPFTPGTFYREVSSHDSCEVLFEDPCPEESPLIEVRAARAAVWPRPARVDDADELFPEGWRVAAVDPEVLERRVRSLNAGERSEYEGLVAGARERAALIEDRTRPDPTPGLPSSVSVSGVIEYATCPKRFYWSHVRPLPRRPSAAARLGSEVHRWIELQTRGQTTLLELEDPPDLATDERLGDPGDERRLKDAFRASRFADRTPLYTERPFLLYLDGMVIQGRIDAVFGEADGPWEVVDYKTGRVPEGDDPLLRLQLDLYALACTEVWGKRPEDLTLTYLYLADGTEVTHRAEDPAATRTRVQAMLEQIAAGRFDPTPGPRCEWCDFRPFCSAGQEYLARRAVPASAEGEERHQGHDRQDGHDGDHHADA